jgi:hypothetical protein
LDDPGVDGRIILRYIFLKWDVWAWSGSICIRIGTRGWHLWMLKWNFGFHKIQGIFHWEPVSFWRRSILRGLGNSSPQDSNIIQLSNKLGMLNFSTIKCKLQI